MSNLAIIPIRMGSKRLPRKNVRNFFGKPIFVYSLEAARESGLFDEIIVSTESEEVRGICAEYGLEVPFMRPEILAGDNCQLVHVLAHVLDEYEDRGHRFDCFCTLWATSPMRTANDIRAAYEMLTRDVEAVVGVTDYDLPVFCALGEGDDGILRPLFPELQKLPSAEQPKAVVDNGSLCWVRVNAFRHHGTWLPPKLKGYHMPRSFSVDIDTQEDWDLAEFQFRRYVLGQKQGIS